jgi:hypothetical protein
MPPKAKPRQSAARLDDLAYMNVDPDAPARVATWVGESKGIKTFDDLMNAGKEVEGKCFNAVKLGRVTYSVGDELALTGDDKDEACELCRLVELYDVDCSSFPKRMQVQWYWRPSALLTWDARKEKPIPLPELGKHEILLSLTHDENPVDLIETCAFLFDVRPRSCHDRCPRSLMVTWSHSFCPQEDRCPRRDAG